MRQLMRDVRMGSPERASVLTVRVRARVRVRAPMAAGAKRTRARSAGARSGQHPSRPQGTNLTAPDTLHSMYAPTDQK
eukprot:8249095-Pyramimonas_sp.AAC.1